MKAHTSFDILLISWFLHLVTTQRIRVFLDTSGKMVRWTIILKSGTLRILSFFGMLILGWQPVFCDVTSSVVNNNFSSLDFRRSSPFAVTSSQRCFCVLYPRADVTSTRDFRVNVFHYFSDVNVNQTWLRLEPSLWPRNSFGGVWINYTSDDVTNSNSATLAVAVQFGGAQATQQMNNDDVITIVMSKHEFKNWLSVPKIYVSLAKIVSCFYKTIISYLNYLFYY